MLLAADGQVSLYTVQFALPQRTEASAERTLGGATVEL